MTSIKGYIENIQSGAIPPDKVPHYLEIISTEVTRLSSLVWSLLDITKIQAGERKFDIKPFDICEMAREIIIFSEQRLEAKNLDVMFDADRDNMFVNADREAIHQILSNICDNAIKFSKEGGRYEVSVKDAGQKTIVSVYNEGVGIPDEDVARIFDRFYKSDKSRGLDKSGVGLGMYISRTIIDAHGENIWAESECGKWCRFTFTMQKASAFPQRKGASERNIKDSGKDLSI
jgi:signal transduction histidine kinase